MASEEESFFTSAQNFNRLCTFCGNSFPLCLAYFWFCAKSRGMCKSDFGQFVILWLVVDEKWVWVNWWGSIKI